MTAEYLTVLHEYSISKNFEDRELYELYKLFTRKSYKAGELIISEDASTTEVFFLEKGTVEITKKIDDKIYSLGNLHKKEIFGELAYLASQKRASNVIAKNDVEVLVLEEKDFSQLPENFNYLKYKLFQHLAVGRLQSNYQQVTSEVILRNKFAKFVIALIIGFCVFISFLQFHKDLLDYIGYYSIGVIGFVTGSLICVYIVVNLKQPLSAFGITLNNWQRSCTEGILICAVVVVIAQLIRADIDFINGIYAMPYLIVYIFISFLQEFIFRGVLVEAFEKFYDSTRIAILLSAFLFGFLHIHAGITVAVISFVAGLFLATLFVRHRNLLGITLVHVCLGNIATLTGIMQQY